MEAIPFFPKLIAYSLIVSSVFCFLLSFYQKQYASWVKSFGEKNAKKILIFMRYIAPPIMILSGAVQLL